MSTIAIKCDICNRDERFIMHKKCYRCSQHFLVCDGCDPNEVKKVLDLSPITSWSCQSENEIDREPIYSVLCKICQRDKKISRYLG